MYTRSESFFNGYDGTKLFLQKWIVENAKGTILFTHGQAEHSDCYLRLINALDGQGWNFIGWDNATTYAGEVDKPIRSYLKAIFLAFSSVTTSNEIIAPNPRC